MTSEEHDFPVVVDGFMSVSDDAFCDEPELRWCEWFVCHLT